MTCRKRVCLLLVFATTAITPSAFCQEVLWTQPYSGNVVAGPFATQSGNLPNCPECECSKCRPEGCEGSFKQFWHGVCHKFQRCRRECYFQKKIYHTGYTQPVLPPYCEPGFGYFETAWRQPIPCIIAGPQGGFPGHPEIVPVVPHPTAPAPMPMDVETVPDAKPPGTIDPKPKYENGSADKVFSDLKGDEKPPFEEVPWERNSAAQKPFPEQAGLAYPYHSFRR